jgi:CHRD domain
MLKPVRIHRDMLMYLIYQLTCLLLALCCCFVSQEKFYLNAHVASDPAALAMMTIRGQLVQKFTASLTGSKEVTPFKGAKNTSGKATVSFEEAGTVACFDASFYQTVKSSSVPVAPFMLAHVHMGAKGTNGAVVLEFTPTRVSSERFFGCRTMKELGISSIQVIADILADPTKFYVNAHVGKAGTDNFNVAVRGQLEYYK